MRKKLSNRDVNGMPPFKVGMTTYLDGRVIAYWSDNTITKSTTKDFKAMKGVKSNDRYSEKNSSLRRRKLEKKESLIKRIAKKINFR